MNLSLERKLNRALRVNQTIWIDEKYLEHIPVTENTITLKIENGIFKDESYDNNRYIPVNNMNGYIYKRFSEHNMDRLIILGIEKVPEMLLNRTIDLKNTHKTFNVVLVDTGTDSRKDYIVYEGLAIIK